ncbi:hypothetical protein SEA_YUCCA_239 [Mycobacterium phage Yucca]|uniref:Uncharacterized protein n=12 Tax=Bixzunavirus TaxID=680114 RepID=R4TQ22_9CAUD|nr:hypothetical protein M182_gp112 [Mycobacterium phage Astraea]YP_009221337.1 hypothetical protein AWH68_gp113 [Mycobacterium phage Breeniome]YP_009288092.1 hypothetical protein BI081_gp128 [Mycobacterium phage Tonenili]YP_010057612.1 hypothetical protein KHO60_gp108 [Mycobacterium phage CharlieB]AEJ95005.1 hypothetical protein GHOST_239 [Mycobacterium phage Ghost]AER49753.1 hypothetical protein PIO_246 [Mycobacterium phage Pio]AID18286.1 hypothetical protein PBI_WILLIS_240 [Mycobacterium ph
MIDPTEEVDDWDRDEWWVDD